MKIQYYSKSSGINGLYKQHLLLGFEGNTSWPLVFLQRPKWIKSDADWQKIVDGITLKLPAGTEIK